MVIDVTCRKCSGFTDYTEVDEKVTINVDVIERVAKFLYLGDVVSYGLEVHEAVTA